MTGPKKVLLVLTLVVAPSCGYSQNTPIGVLSQFTSSGSQLEVARAIGTLCPAGNRVSARLQQDCNNLIGAAFGNESTVRNAISTITPDSARVAVDRGQLLQGSPMRAGNVGGGGGSFAGGGGSFAPFAAAWMSEDGDRHAGAGADFGAWGLYATAELNRNERDASLNQDGFDDDTRRFMVGVDRRLDGGWVLGGSLVLARSEVDFSGASGGQDIDEQGLNLHASWAGERGWYADGLLSIGQRETDQRRRTQYATASGGGVNQTYRARFDSDTRLLAVTLGHRFDQGGWSFDPYAQLESLRADVDAYDEIASAPDAAGGGWAVNADAQEERFLRGTLGLRASWVISGSNGVFLPYLDLGLVRVLDAEENDARVRYTGDRSDAVGLQRLSFAMRADPEDDVSGRLAVGIVAQFAHGRSGFVRYAQNFSETRYTSREFQLGGRFEF